MNYFIHDGNEEAGPFSVEELKSKRISRDIHVWREGLGSWQPAGTLQELEQVFHIPPPFASVRSTESFSEPPQSSAYRIGKTVGMALVVIAIIIALFFAGGFIYDQYEQRNMTRIEKKENMVAQLKEDHRKYIRENITSYVTAERNSYKYSELGGIYGLKITVINNSDYLLEQVKVKITYIKASGDVYDNKIVEFNYIDANSKLTLPIEDTNRGVKVIYEIVAIKSASLNL